MPLLPRHGNLKPGGLNDRKESEALMNIQLNTTQKIAVQSIASAQQNLETQRQQLEANAAQVEQERRDVISEIEVAYGLPTGSIGTTHLLTTNELIEQPAAQE